LINGAAVDDREKLRPCWPGLRTEAMMMDEGRVQRWSEDARYDAIEGI
jgi:hypothetical protein